MHGRTPTADEARPDEGRGDRRAADSARPAATSTCTSSGAPQCPTTSSPPLTSTVGSAGVGGERWRAPCRLGRRSWRSGCSPSCTSSGRGGPGPTSPARSPASIAEPDAEAIEIETERIIAMCVPLELDDDAEYADVGAAKYTSTTIQTAEQRILTDRHRGPVAVRHRTPCATRCSATTRSPPSTRSPPAAAGWRPIVGPAGAGKTTMLRSVAATCDAAGRDVDRAHAVSGCGAGRHRRDRPAGDHDRRVAGRRRRHAPWRGRDRRRGLDGAHAGARRDDPRRRHLRLQGRADRRLRPDGRPRSRRPPARPRRPADAPSSSPPCAGSASRGKPTPPSSCGPANPRSPTTYEQPRPHRRVDHRHRVRRRRRRLVGRHRRRSTLAGRRRHRQRRRRRQHPLPAAPHRRRPARRPRRRRRRRLPHPHRRPRSRPAATPATSPPATTDASSTATSGPSPASPPTAPSTSATPHRPATAVLPAGYVTDDVVLAYATTIAGAQGRTVDRGHVVVTPRTTSASLYVGMTRRPRHQPRPRRLRQPRPRRVPTRRPHRSPSLRRRHPPRRRRPTVGPHRPTTLGSRPGRPRHRPSRRPTPPPGHRLVDDPRTQPPTGDARRHRRPSPPHPRDPGRLPERRQPTRRHQPCRLAVDWRRPGAVERFLDRLNRTPTAGARQHGALIRGAVYER